MIIDNELQSFMLFVLSVGGAYTTTIITFVNLRSQVKVNQDAIKEIKSETEQRTSTLNKIERSVIRIESKLTNFTETLERNRTESIEAHERNVVEIEALKKKLENNN